MPKFVIRIVLTVLALGFLVTACGRKDSDLQKQVLGTWNQGPHTLTLAADGSYLSIFPGRPMITYKAKWRIERGYLVVTDVKSNSVPMAAGNTTVKIVAVDKHRLEMALGTNRITMLR
jgi:hypothetical protein